MRVFLILLVLNWLRLTPVIAAESDSRDQFLLKGSVSVVPSLLPHIAATDRLIIKLYHPGADGLEMDTTYQIINRFTLPFEFIVGPAVGMSGSTKHKSYIVEVFTDKDKDVLSVAPNELYGHSGQPIRLGTSGIELKLDTQR